MELPLELAAGALLPVRQQLLEEMKRAGERALPAEREGVVREEELRALGKSIVDFICSISSGQ